LDLKGYSFPHENKIRRKLGLDTSVLLTKSAKDRESETREVCSLHQNENDSPDPKNKKMLRINRMQGTSSPLAPKKNPDSL